MSFTPRSPRPPSPDVVNVASVPQRSPFRYPGGKSWLIPRFRAWIRSLASRPALLVEPFAGGGAIGLTAAMEGLAERVLLGELDPDVAAVWRTLLEGDFNALIDRIMRFEMSRSEVIKAVDRPTRDDLDLAFRTLLRNRVQRGGILAPGASLIRTGENGRGIACRWYPQTLARRIRAIAQVRDRLRFIEGDGLELIARFETDPGAAFFIDPPYTAGGKRAGRRLYAFNALDHERLFALLAAARGPALITYDDAPEPRALARRHGFAVRRVPMANTHHSRLVELLIMKAEPRADRP